MPDGVDELLHEIAAGFHENPLTAALALAFVLAFAGVLLLFHLKQERTLTRERALLYASRYEELMRSLKLPAGSATLIDRLARYLRDPSRRYQLLTNEATFNSCLRKMRSEGAISPALVASLRFRLGYRAENPDKIPLSSGDVTEGTTMEMARKQPVAASGAERGVKATVRKVVDDYMEIELDEAMSLRRGEGITFHFYNFAGLYSWSTKVLHVEGSVVRVAHSGFIEGVQRRRYYRRRIDRPVYIRRAESEEGFIKSLFRDLGGGGARLINPKDIYERGDSLELSFDSGSRGWIRLAAEVVRTYPDGTLSVRFGKVRESTRDIILRGLFRSYLTDVREREARARDAVRENEEAGPDARGEGVT